MTDHDYLVQVRMSPIVVIFTVRKRHSMSLFDLTGALRQNTWVSALVEICSAKGCAGVSSDGQVRT